MPKKAAYIALGSNLGNPLEQIQNAALKLARSFGGGRLSGIYRTAPWGPVPQPDYLNGVLEIACDLNGLELLHHLRKLETEFGRQREVRYGPRTLDLDLLVMGDDVHECEELSLPHPRIHERVFVLHPLMDLNPMLLIPGQGRVQELFQRLNNFEEILEQVAVPVSLKAA